MAKNLYPKGAERILNAQISFASDTIKVALLSDGYTYSAAHEFLANVSANVVGTAQILATKTIAGGVFDAADVEFGALAAGSTVKAFILYRDTGVAGTSPLLIYSDEATGFPFATSGGSVTVPWSNGPAKIMSLV